MTFHKSKDKIFVQLVKETMCHLWIQQMLWRLSDHVPAHICWTCEQAQSGEVTKHLLMFLLLGGQAKYFAAEKCNLWKDTCLVCKCFVKYTKIDKHDMIWHDMSPTLEYQSFKLRDRKAGWKVRSCTPELLFVVLPVLLPLICTHSIVTWG